ncbi:MAG: EFR1 family ferrodoxin [Bacillota bacterium]|nr:EFR1 family ferrodoxin [Bacillota bacterium]
MILYYSSTGNSYHVAQEIARQHLGELINMAKPGDRQRYVLADGETLFIVTFNCFWGVSKLVRDFFRLHQFSNVQTIVAVITCGGYLGAGDHALQRILKAKNLPQAAVYDLIMVTNYVVFHEVPEPDAQKQALTAADSRLQQILSGQAKPYCSSAPVRILGIFVHGLYAIFRRTKAFSVSGACIGCGKCVRDCPVQAMEIFQGKVRWRKKSCDHCLKCLHSCPTLAINYGRYGRSTLGKRRYRYPGP